MSWNAFLKSVPKACQSLSSVSAYVGGISAVRSPTTAHLSWLIFSSTHLSTLFPLMKERHRAILWNGLIIASVLLLTIHQIWNCSMNLLVWDRSPLKTSGGAPFMVSLVPWGACPTCCGATACG